MGVQRSAIFRHLCDCASGRPPLVAIRGWGNYFSYGHIYRVRQALDKYVEESVRAFLRRRHHTAGRGTQRFSKEYIRDQLGVDFLEAMPRWQPVHA